MPVKVPDASVLAAIAFGEPRAAEARRLLAGADLCAPTLLPYELVNVTWKIARTMPDLRDALVGGLAGVLALAIELVQVDHAEVLALALAQRITTYDASYLWLARARGAKLVSFDRVLQVASRG